MLSLATTALRVSVGMVLLAASGAKLESFGPFKRALTALGLPRAGAPILGTALVLLEAGVGIYLVILADSRIGDVAALSLLGGLALTSAYAVASGRKVSCSCFGRSERPLGLGTLALALSLLVSELTYVTHSALTNAGEPQGKDLAAAWSLALSLLAVALWVRAARPLVAMTIQRRTLERGTR